MTTVFVQNQIAFGRIDLHIQKSYKAMERTESANSRRRTGKAGFTTPALLRTVSVAAWILLHHPTNAVANFCELERGCRLSVHVSVI